MLFLVQEMLNTGKVPAPETVSWLTTENYSSEEFRHY